MDRALTRRALLVGATACPATAWAMSDEEFRERLRRSLLERPEIVREAVMELQRREMESQERARAETLRARRAELLENPDSPIIGPRDARIAIVEFYDVRCGFCRQAAATVKEVLAANPDTKLVLKGLPILGPASVLGEKAVLVAARHGKHEFVLKRLLEGPMEFGRAEVEAILRDAGVQAEAIASGLSDPSLDGRIARVMELARALGIGGTPAFVVGERLLPGAVPRAVLEEAVAEARRRG